MAVELAIAIEGLIPYVVPFVVGIIVGLLAKTLLKVAVGVFALAVILSWGGYESFPSVQQLFDKVQSSLPEIFDGGHGFLNALPVTAPSFVIGLLIGIWRG